MIKLKKFLCIILSVLLLLGTCLFSSIMAFSVEKGDDGSSTILIIDNSVSMDGTPIQKAKEAAKLFCDKLLANDVEVGIVVYDTSVVSTCYPTTDINKLNSAINQLNGYGSWTNTTAALEKAATMFDSSKDKQQNIVVMTDGLPTYGKSEINGQYLSTDYLGSNYGYDYELYRYANSLYSEAVGLWEENNIISLGFFHNLNSENFSFCSRLLNDIQNAGYYPITSVDDLNTIIGDIVNIISKNNYMFDTDGDGLPDEWETNGIDIDEDGVIDLALNKMGADPNKPDIFVEVDWMVNSTHNFRPTSTAMRMVYEAFQNSPNGGINIHIDFGSDSTDFVTGKRWSSYPGGSGGNSVSFSANLDLTNNYSQWENIVENNFSEARRRVFRHALFAFKYNNGTSSGIASGIPGQMFIVANAGWIDSDLEVAGTFMHELGHTLGLRHGGNDHEHYKPNYLSVMNYLFQTTGLVGRGSSNAKLDYSRYVLPTINEKSLVESSGFDPNGVTSGTGLGTKWHNGSKFLWFAINGEEKTVFEISRNAVDFNCDGDTDDSSLKVDVNNSGSYEELESYNDWDNIVYSGGAIGANGTRLPEIEINPPEVLLDEITKEEAIESGLLVPVLSETTNLQYKEDYTFDNNDNDKVKWSSSNENVVVVDEITGEVHYKSAGSATVYAEVDGEVVAQTDVEVSYTWWQWIIRIFLLGFIWY